MTSSGHLRAVYIGHCALLSGGELALLRLLPALDGVNGTVILGEDGPLVSRLEQAGVTVEVLPMSDVARSFRKDRVRSGVAPFVAVGATVVYVVRLARRLRQLRPDLVHTNTLKAAFYGTAAARLAGVPVVCHVRDRISPDYLPPMAVKASQLVVRTLATTVIANSHATLASLRLGRQATRSHVIYDPSPEMAPVGRKETAPLRVAMVGRIAPWKGQDVFLKAFASAFPAGPETAKVVGAALFGETDYEAELHRLAASLGIAERIEFTGFREDIGDELADADVLVHASVVPEPFGQVVVEGMAAALPVVATAAGGPAEVIEDGVTGLLYPPGDATALAEALLRLAASSELRQRLGEAARRKAEMFRPPAIAAQVQAVYRATVDRRPRFRRTRTTAATAGGTRTSK